jgi:WD40 repeat protein
MFGNAFCPVLSQPLAVEKEDSSAKESSNPEIELIAMQKRSDDLQALPATDKFEFKPDCQSFFSLKLKELEGRIAKARQSGEKFKLFQSLCDLADFYYLDYEMVEKAEPLLAEAVEVAYQLPEKNVLPDELMAKAKKCAKGDKSMLASLDKASQSMDVNTIAIVFDKLCDFARNHADGSIGPDEIAESVRLNAETAIREVIKRSSALPDALLKQAKFCWQNNREKRALELFKEASRIANQRFGEDSRLACKYHDALTDALVDLQTKDYASSSEAFGLLKNDRKAAEVTLLELLKKRQKLFGPSIEAASVLRMLGGFYREVRDLRRSEICYADAVDMIYCARGCCIEEEAQALHELAGTLFQQHYYAQAEECDRKGLSIRSRLHTKYDREVDGSYSLFSETMSRIPDDDNKRYLARLINLRAEHFGIGSAKVMQGYARLKGANASYEGSAKFADQIVAARKAIYGEKDARFADSLIYQAQQTSNEEERRQIYLSAYSIYKACEKLDTENAAVALIGMIQFPELREYERTKAGDEKLLEATACVSDFLKINRKALELHPSKFLFTLDRLSSAIDDARQLGSDDRAVLARPLVDDCKFFAKQAEQNADWIGTSELITLMQLLARYKLDDDLLKVATSGRSKVSQLGKISFALKLLRRAENLFKDDLTTAVCLSISPDNKLLALLASDNSMRVYNLETKEVKQFAINGRILTLCFNSTGEVIASGDSDGIIQLWDTREGKSIAKVEPLKIEKPAESKPRTYRSFRNEHISNRIEHLTFGDDDNVMVSAGEFGIVFWKKATDGKWTGNLATSGKTNDVTTSSDRRLFTATSDDLLTLWDAHDLKKLGDFPGLKHSRTSAVSHDGKLVAGGNFESFQVWETATGKTIFTPPAFASEAERKVPANIRFSSDNKTLIVSYAGGELSYWNLTTGKLMATKTVVLKYGRSKESAFSINSDGTVIGAVSGSVDIYRAVSGNTVLSKSSFGNLNPEKTANLHSMLKLASPIWNECEPYDKNTYSSHVLGAMWDLSSEFVASFGDSSIQRQLNEPTSRPIPPNGNLYVVCVGINECGWGLNEQIKLPVYIDDSKAILEAIQSKCSNSFDKIEVLNLENRQASMSGIWKAMLEVQKKSDFQDTFVFVFSGVSRKFKDSVALLPWIDKCYGRRGSPFDKCPAYSFQMPTGSREYGLWTTSATSVNPIDDFGYTPLLLTAKAISERARAIKAGKQIFVLNASDSSEIAEAISKINYSKYNDVENYLPERLLLAQSGFGAIRKDQDSEDSNPSSGKNSSIGTMSTRTSSALTTVLIDGLNGKADPSNSGTITAYKLWAYFNGAGKLFAESEAYGSSLLAIRPQSNFTICKIQSSPEVRTAVAISGKKKVPEEVVRRLSSRNLAVFIATNSYDDAANWTELRNPEPDAEQLAAIFQEHYGWETKLYKHPSGVEFGKILDDITNLNYGDGQLFIYIAGHGCFLPKKRIGYIVAKDSDINDARTMISLSDLQDQLSRGECKHVVLALDICYAGTMLDSIAKYMSTQVRAPNGPDIYENASLEKVCKQTSGHDTYKLLAPAIGPAYEGAKGRHSPFADKLIKVLKEGGGQRKPPFLRYNDLAKAAIDTVGDKSIGVAGDFAEHPDSMGEFIIVRKENSNEPVASDSTKPAKPVERDLMELTPQNASE